MALSMMDKVEFFQLRLKARIDARVTACRVDVVRGEGRRVTLSGYSHYRQTDAFVRSVAAEVFGADNVSFELKVLERGVPKFAVVMVPAAPLWSVADASVPERLGSEVLYGAVVRVYHHEGAFSFVQAPDGYLGYCPTDALARVSVEDYLAWKNGLRAVTLAPVVAGDVTVPVGARLVFSDGYLVLPGGDRVKVRRRDVVVSDPADAKFVSILRERAERFMESPYLWGGRSAVGIDCSGFVQTLMQQEGIFLPRDASQQCHVGEIVGYLPGMGDLLPGDVMFFMNKSAFVFHVGIYLGDNLFMHSAGKTGPTVSSVLRTGDNFMARYHGTFCYARRVH